MPGGMIVLIANGTGTEHAVLINNPQFSYFKTVFRRHTNFATEPIELPLIGPSTLPFDSSITLKCGVPRHAELMSHLYLVVDLPPIYSGYTTNGGDNDSTYGHRFHWIRDLGTRLIDSVSLTIGGTQVQHLTGEWIALWYKMFAPEDVDLNVLNEMTGNVPECYDPANTSHAMGVYPTATLQSTLDTDPELTTDSGVVGASRITNPYLRTASIPARTLHIPIPFWFSAHSGAALPLVALQHHEVEVQVTLRRLRDLYTVYDPETGTQVAPTSAIPHYPIGQYQTAHTLESLGGVGNDATIDMRLSEGLRNDTGLPSLAPRLLAGYVFLDDSEQALFASSTHRYLIEQVDYPGPYKGVHGTQSVDLMMNHPVKTIVWCAQRESVSCTNNWSNYTNQTTPGGVIPSTSLRAYRPTLTEVVSKQIETGGGGGGNTVPLSGFVSRMDAAAGVPILPVTRFEYPNTSPTIIQSATLLFNGIELLCTQPTPYFCSLQPLQCRQRQSPAGVCSYSFALNSRVVRQPSGACDTSRVKKVQLQVTTLEPVTAADGITEEPEYTLRVFVVRYNVLRLMGGMGGVEFAN